MEACRGGEVMSKGLMPELMSRLMSCRIIFLDSCCMGDALDTETITMMTADRPLLWEPKRSERSERMMIVTVDVAAGLGFRKPDEKAGE